MPNTNIERKTGFFHALGRVLTKDTEDILTTSYKSSHNLKDDEIWVPLTPFPFVGAGDPIAFAEFSSRTDVKYYQDFPLTVAPGSNNQAWYINDGGKFIKKWISPTDIPNSVTNLPSNGLIPIVKDGLGNLIPAGNSQYWIDWYAGMLKFEDTGNPTTGIPANLPPSISLFVYDGPTLQDALSGLTAKKLSGLTDVSVSGITDGQILIYSAGTWYNQDIPAQAISGLTDVLLTGLTDGQYLTYSAGTWINTTLPPSSNALSGLSDVNISGLTLVDGDLLVYSGGTWTVVQNILNFWTSAETLAYLQNNYYTTGQTYSNTEIDILLSGYTPTGFSYSKAEVYNTGETLTILQGYQVTGMTMALSGLTDVNVSGVSNGEVLIYDSAQEKWIPAVLSGLTSGSTVIGPPRNSYDNGLLPFTNETPVGYAVDDINVILALLAPAKPVNLSSRTLVIPSLYSASEQGTGVVRTTLTDDTTPTATVSGAFWDGKGGNLTVYIDGGLCGQRTLTPSGNTGTYGALTILTNVDPFAGVAGKEGFWMQLTANMTTETGITASNAAHVYRMTHNTTASDINTTFYIDAPTSPNISATSDSLPVITRYVSGVPSLASGQNITVAFTLNNAIGLYYKTTGIATVSSSNTTTTSVNPIGTPIQGASLNYTGVLVSVNNLTYSENINLIVTPYNSKSVAGSTSTIVTGSRVDTISNESTRLVAGSGLYPGSGYGSAFNSNNSLKTIYIEELQLLSGIYQWPTGNYTANLPTAGEDYSTSMGSSDRYVIFNMGSISTKNATITINSAVNFVGSGTETAGVSIHARVDGSNPTNGWVNINKSYSGVGDPTNNGDFAMLYADSSETVKKFTFGGIVRTGTLYIRIGLPVGSTKKFKNLTLS